ncbi:MAG: FGGY-family carbohydrate kinase [Vicinamibacterales bacterium]|jgi:rhamnulokinase|nr:rhamnulokinase [Acidobacteriota bacterium]MDP6371953.1 FGGY-family carbohydrate kinase [Vicinamibacterales bacterium]MDP6607728.1 FGGY-family carbohydrate kinase [Vicinamibacterales bacterium]HAK55810.1 rhamnulokinase [Acidobacteriota bacterium]|tara:strand:+ start:1568 stop:3037 length:1470 start_codon:yes stop_codon:yes gene_type:complete
MPAYVAVDLGASSGRVIVGSVDDHRVSLEVAHRFANTPYQSAGHERWPFATLLAEVQAGLARVAAAGVAPVSVGVDTWGVDYGLLDADGHLLGDPVSYRDARTEGVVSRVHQRIPATEVFRCTGLQTLALNTLFQVVAQRDAGEWPADASRLLMMPDLVHNALCGSIVGEETIASTTQLLDAATRRWAPGLFERLGLSLDVMPELVPPGTKLGRLRPDVGGAAGLPDVDVVAPAAHDTASAVVGAPIAAGWAYLSSGTWSLLGVETTTSVLNDAVRDANLTNEAGAERTNRLLKNIAGMWILESCRKSWAASGTPIARDALDARIAAAPARQAFILPDASQFFNPPDMPAAVTALLGESGQRVPDDPGGFARVILESLALRYASVVAEIEQATGQSIRGIRIIGGGSQNRFLNQATADATGREVRAGPVEATALGNVIVQAIADGCFGSVAEARLAVGRDWAGEAYEPRDAEAWADARARYAQLEADFA